MLKVAVLVSGGGSNLQSILDYGQETFKVEMVIGSKEGIYGLERAKNAGIPSYVVSKKEYGNETSNKILELTKGKVDLIVLAGYLSILDGEILKAFKEKKGASAPLIIEYGDIEYSGIFMGAYGVKPGFYVENGKKTFPVEQITVAGNYFDLLKNIVVVGNDLKFPMSNIGSPSVIVEGLSIAGK